MRGRGLSASAASGTIFVSTRQFRPRPRRGPRLLPRITRYLAPDGRYPVSYRFPRVAGPHDGQGAAELRPHRGRRSRRARPEAIRYFCRISVVSGPRTTIPPYAVLSAWSMARTQLVLARAVMEGVLSHCATGSMPWEPRARTPAAVVAVGWWRALRYMARDACHDLRHADRRPASGEHGAVFGAHRGLQSSPSENAEAHAVIRALPSEIGSTIAPDARRKTAYVRGHARFRDAYQALRPRFAQPASILK